MKKDRRPTIGTLLLIVLTLVIVDFYRTRRQASQPESAMSGPQEAVYGLLDAAKRGDIRAYMDQYAGAMKADLKQVVSEKGDMEFRRYLQSSNGEIRGVAVMEPKFLSPNEAEVRVEYVYQDRNEQQTMLMRQQSGSWKIFSVHTADRVPTLVPYGTAAE